MAFHCLRPPGLSASCLYERCRDAAGSEDLVQRTLVGLRLQAEIPDTRRRGEFEAGILAEVGCRCDERNMLHI